MESLSYELINIIENELNKPEIKEKINKKCIEPLVTNLTEKIHKYFVAIIVLYGIIIACQLIIITTLFMRKK